jgi:hypothetical protein
MEFLTFLVSLTGTETITIGAMCGHLKQRNKILYSKGDLILRSTKRMLQMQFSMARRFKLQVLKVF